MEIMWVNNGFGNRPKNVLKWQNLAMTLLVV
jgi:hypothetical protein